MATLDVLSTAEGRTAVGLGSDTSKDTPLAQAITAVSGQLDKLCGPIVTRAATFYLDGGTSSIRVPRVPVLTFTTVTEYTGTTSQVLTAETNATKTATNYFHAGTLGTINSGTVHRRSSGTDGTFPAGRGNIEVVTTLGRAADTASVDAKFKQAAAMMLRNIWVGEMASGTETFGGFADLDVNPLLGPGMLNKVAALLVGEILDGVYVG